MEECDSKLEMVLLIIYQADWLIRYGKQRTQAGVCITCLYGEKAGDRTNLRLITKAKNYILV